MRLEVLSDTAIRELEPAGLMTLIAHVQRFIDKAVAYQRHLIAVAESQRSARAVGDACVADSLVRNTGMSRGAARRAARQAKIIAEKPAVAGALASGDINADQAEAIARADIADETRRALIASAASEGTDATRERAAAAEIASRDETPEQRFMRQHANRFLRFYNNRDGMVCLEGALDPDNGARLKAKITAIANRMWQKDKQQPPGRRRNPEQRDIDALCAATSQPRRPSPGGSTARAEEDGDLDDIEWVDYDNEGKRIVPVLRVSTSLDALRDGLHRASITDSGESLSAATVRRLACDADIIPTVLNGKGRVIDVGRRTRRVSEVLRCVLIARDGGCVWPGCDAAPSRCDAHHVKHWADGGPTDADNLALLCHRHHTLLHEGRHRLKRVGDTWVVLKPDGTRLHAPLAAVGGDTGSADTRQQAAARSCAPDRDPLWDLDGPTIPDRSADGRLPGGAPTASQTQLILACHNRGEMTIRLTTADLRSSRVGHRNLAGSDTRLATGIHTAAQGRARSADAPLANARLLANTSQTARRSASPAHAAPWTPRARARSPGNNEKDPTSANRTPADARHTPTPTRRHRGRPNQREPHPRRRPTHTDTHQATPTRYDECLPAAMSAAVETNDRSADDGRRTVRAKHGASRGCLHRSLRPHCRRPGRVCVGVTRCRTLVALCGP